MLVAAFESRLTCTVEELSPVTVVTVSGQLGLTTVADLRTCVLKCLVDQPAAIIVDLAEATVVDDMAVVVFPALVRHADAWPGCPITLSAGSVHTAGILDRLGVTSRLPVFGSYPEARRHAARCPVPARVTERLPPEPRSASLARRIVSDTCRRWSLPHLVEAAQVVTTELVANAVRHARTMIDFTVTHPGRRLQLAVRDYARALPRFALATEYATRGRGLLIVEGFAAKWGSVPMPDGKVVWATLR